MFNKHLRIKSTYGRAAEQFLTSLFPLTSVSGVYTCKRRRWGRGENVRGSLCQLRWWWRWLGDEGINLLRVKRAVFADVSVGGGGVGFWCITVDTWSVVRTESPPWGRAAQPVKSVLLNLDRLYLVFHNSPECPSRQLNVVAVVTVRCLGRDWSRLVSWAASVAVLLSSKMPLLTGVLTAEKERVFLGVAAWLRDKDRPPELDCCFLLRSVLRAQAGRRHKKAVKLQAGR